MTFGPDGNLYVDGCEQQQRRPVQRHHGRVYRNVRRRRFRRAELARRGSTFDPSGAYLYVASSGGTNEVLKYNAQTGAYVGVAASGADAAHGMSSSARTDCCTCSRAGPIASCASRRTAPTSMITSRPAAAACPVSQCMTFGPNGDLYVYDDGQQPDSPIRHRERSALHRLALDCVCRCRSR